MARRGRHACHETCHETCVKTCGETFAIPHATTHHTARHTTPFTGTCQRVCTTSWHLLSLYTSILTLLYTSILTLHFLRVHRGALALMHGLHRDVHAARALSVTFAFIQNSGGYDIKRNQEQKRVSSNGAREGGNIRGLPSNSGLSIRGLAETNHDDLTIQEFSSRIIQKRSNNAFG